MESGFRVVTKKTEKKGSEVCPLGISRFLQEQNTTLVAEEYKQIANAIGLFNDDELEIPNSPKSPRSPILSPRGSRKSKQVKKLDQLDKVDGIIMLLELLGKMEVSLSRTGLDASLDVAAEVRKIYVWLTDAKNLETVKKELKQKLDKKDSKDGSKLLLLEKMIEKEYTPDLIRYSALAMYSTSLSKEAPEVHGTFKPIKLSAAAETIEKELRVLQLKLEKKHNKRKLKNEKIDEKLNKKITDLEKKIHFKKLYQSKVNRLIDSLNGVNFSEPAHVNARPGKGLTRASMFSNTKLLETLGVRFEDLRYANFRKYEKLLKLAIELLKNPEFVQLEDKKAEEELGKIITFLQSQLEHLLTESSRLRDKLKAENEVFHFANEVISKIDFTQLATTFANTGARKAETKLIRESLGEEYQVDAYNEEGEGNAAVYVIYKKSKEEEKEEDSEDEEKGSEVIPLTEDAPNKETKAKPKPVGPAIVIRAQNMNIHDLQTMSSPKHLIQRTSSALDFSEPGFTKQYALMPGIAPDVPTGEDKVYRNYEVSEAVFGGDLKKMFEKLHENIAKEPMNRDNAIGLLQVEFVSYAKKLIQFFMELKAHGICYTDLKPSNVLIQVKISDDKTGVNISHLAEDEYFYPRETQFLQLTSGFYSPTIQKRDGNGKTCYDMDQLARDTLVFTLYQMISGENLEDPKHRFDSAEMQSIMLSAIKDGNAPIFEGPMGKEIMGAYDMLLAFRVSKEISLEALFEVFSALEKDLTKLDADKPLDSKKEFGLGLTSQQ